MEKDKKKRESYFKVFVAFAFVLLCLFPFVFCFASGKKASAAVISLDNFVYSDVLEDLQKDSAFNEEDYPVIENDYSLKVIQLAESVNNELFIYVYQPCSDLIATTIRISTGINDNAKWVDYKLSLKSSQGVFAKYVVEGLIVKSDALRYYDVSAISRKFNDKYDKKPSNGNVINEVSFEVGFLWTFVTVNDNVSCNATKVETIEITGKYVGFIRYKNGFVFHEYSCDSHFVAFSTNKRIDNLLEVDVDYITRTFETKGNPGGGMLVSLNTEVSALSNDYNYGEPTSATATVSYTDEETITVGHIFRKKYSFNRIESTSKFLTNSDYNLSDIAKEELAGKDWVLRFAETDYSSKTTSGIFPTVTEKGVKVEQVSIMRLKFETEGVVYNLGVIDNKQTGSELPSGSTEDLLLKLLKFLEKYWWLILLVIIGLPCLIALLPTIIPFLVWLVVGVFKFIWLLIKAVFWIITFPFQLFKNRDK